MKTFCKLFLFYAALLLSTFVHAQEKTDAFLQHLLYSSASPALKNVLDHPETYQYQIIYTQIDRDKKGVPHFKNYYLHVDKDQYFNPASTVKLPTALAALEKINSLRKKGIDKFTPLQIDSAFSSQTKVVNDTSSENGKASVAQYIKKIFLVSDNDAYNRLYEFVGQQYLNESLWQKGFQNVRITRRFVPMNTEENRHTNPVNFIKANQTIYAQPAANSNVKFNFDKKILIGKGRFNWNDSLINEPFDFTTHNNLPLEDLQRMVQTVMFPKSVKKRQRFHLTESDYKFLYRYMSMLPSQSHYPNYDTTEFFDAYAKFFYKTDKKLPAHIRIFNKPGWSYGFLTDAAYVADTKNNLEYMLSAVIYVNADGILNDNKYEYEEIGYPFFKDINSAIYQYELKRKRTYKPNFSRFLQNSRSVINETF